MEMPIYEFTNAIMYGKFNCTNCGEKIKRGTTVYIGVRYMGITTPHWCEKCYKTWEAPTKGDMEELILKMIEDTRAHIKFYMEENDELMKDLMEGEMESAIVYQGNLGKINAFQTDLFRLERIVSLSSKGV